MVTVHVMDPPRDEEGDQRATGPDERLCLEDDCGEGTVFHPNAEAIGAHWRCPDCGETSSGAEA